MSKNRWFVILSIVIALVLDILPLPDWGIWLAPHWTFLVVMYWLIMLPNIIDLFGVFLIGIILDLLSNSLLGLHAFPLILIAYLVLKFHRQIQNFPLVQQSFIIAILLFLDLFMVFVLQNIFGFELYRYSYWFSVVSSAILWPWIWIILRNFQRKYTIS